MPDGDGALLPGPLTASVTAGESGPVIMLCGEADLTSAGQLSALITAQVSRGTRQLTVDVSGLRFADLATIRTLVLAARTLQERGGDLILLCPRRPVAKVLALTGADQMFIIRETHSEPEPKSEAGLTALPYHWGPNGYGAPRPGPGRLVRDYQQRAGITEQTVPGSCPCPADWRLRSWVAIGTERRRHGHQQAEGSCPA
jgi:anti-anti-sigma factor